MNFTLQVITYAVIIGLLLIWAKSSKLDFGLRRPSLHGIWPWLLAYLMWTPFNWVLTPSLSITTEAEVSDPFEQLSVLELIVLVVVAGPLMEEVLFRGALFAAAIRWGAWAAIVLPSLLWGALHFENGELAVIYFSVAGLILAAIRWKSGSIYIPLVIHATENMLIGLIYY